MHKLAGVSPANRRRAASIARSSAIGPTRRRVVSGGRERPGLLDDARIRSLVPDFVERMQYLDTLTYLPDDILTKVDRASMAVSLEARVPLLDHRVVALQLVAAAGDEARQRHRQVAVAPRARPLRPARADRSAENGLRRAARPTGCAASLRDWAENLLDRGAWSAMAFSTPTRDPPALAEHLAGKRNWQASLWAVLMFQAWKERWLA